MYIFDVFYLSISISDNFLRLLLYIVLFIALQLSSLVTNYKN